MVNNKSAGSERNHADTLSIHPIALAVFSIGLVLAGGFLGSGILARPSAKAATSHKPAAGEADARPKEVPAWGELVTTDVLIERPEEYVSIETGTNQPSEWQFEKRTPQQVRDLMLTSGMSPAQIESLFVQGKVRATTGGATVLPGDDIVFALPPHARAVLYQAQSHNDANRYIATPFYFAGEPEAWLSGSSLEPTEVALFKKLVYRSGSLNFFSDLEVMLRALPDEKDRLTFLKAVSRQPAVLVNVRVRPDTDIDRLLGYWNPGARVKDARPLLESLKRLPDGGAVSLVHLLPTFARDRVFTFPHLSSGPAEPAMDCHWSSMNFFNETPDNRFAQPGYMFWYLQNNYYTVWKPNLYGDLVLVVRDNTNVLHSAVYLADDIVFTKNGNNVHQPWTFMRIKDLLAMYDRGSGTALHYYRQKSR